MFKRDNFAENFDDIDLSSSTIEKVEFDSCCFKGCHFPRTLFKGCRFFECTFKNCDLSIIEVSDSHFSDIIFEDCKIVGVDWTKASWESLTIRALKFIRCSLVGSSFFGMDLQKWCFKESIVNDVDFRYANLTEADMRESDFCDTFFKETNLSRANFVDAKRFCIDVRQNQLEGAKFSRYEALRLLDGLGIELEG